MSKFITILAGFTIILGIGVFIFVNLYGQGSVHIQSGSKQEVTKNLSPTPVPTQEALESFKKIEVQDRYSFEQLQSVLPEGTLLREFTYIPGVTPTSYLLLYVEKGNKLDDWGYDSCPGMILGVAIAGNYHLALFQNGTVISDVKIPKPSDYDDATSLELVYKNTKENIFGLDANASDANEVIVASLLQLKDYTGEGKKYEVVFTTTQGGCGIFDGLVAGYDPEDNKVRLYSDWIPRFSPNSSGEFNYLFECGDHGNVTRIEETYEFDKSAKKFIQTSHKETPCEE